MTKIKDNCVLITGGASGIGRIMGRMALEKGAPSKGTKTSRVCRSVSTLYASVRVCFPQRGLTLSSAIGWAYILR